MYRATFAVPLFAAALAAQSITLDAAALPTRLEAVAAGLPPAALAVCVLGLEPVHAVLPGGAVLGVRPDVVAGLGVVEATGAAELATGLDPRLCAGLAFLVQVVALAPGGAFATTPVRAVRAPAPGDLADVYVLFGQSNAEGYAPVEELPDGLRGAMPRARVWDLATGTFAALCAGRNGRTLTTRDWCGPELALARGLADADGTIHLVKLGAGATSLGPSPGPLDEWGADAGELYALLLDVVGDACADLHAQGLVPRVRGLAMMQGESDAVTAELAHGYEGRFARLVQQLRRDLVAARLTNDGETPFAFGRIARGLPAAVFPFVAEVRAAQAAVASTERRCAMVDTDALALQPDATHFATDGVVGLGLGLAAALRRLGAGR